MRLLQPVHIEAMDLRRFEPVISSAEYQDLLALISRAAAALQGRVIWNVNSTAAGGGVAELLRTLLGYSRGGGVDARWLVLSGDRLSSRSPSAFTTTSTASTETDAT